MILYKYVPPARIDVLQSGLVAFPPPWAFNDPFDVSPVYDENDAESVALAEANNPVWDTLTKQQQDAILDRVRDLDAAYDTRRLTLEHAARMVGVLSLSGKNDNLLMWAHYTAQHTGFVIGFDTGNAAWIERQRRDGPPGEPTKVTYAEARPKPVKIADFRPEDIWYTKSSEWDYEDEWRFTRLLRTAAMTAKSPDGDEIPLHEFPKEAGREVILGCRADNILEGEILEIVTKPPYRSVTVRRAEVDQSTFKLNIVPR